MSLTPTARERRKEYARFLLMFVFLGFAMKILSEFIHEMGHAFTVLMLGGEILGISIRAEWPFTLSHTRWVIPNPTRMNLAMIAIAGILFETVTSIVGQSILLLRRRMRPVYQVSIFWLSFWTYLSPVVYLLMGAFQPFGDVLDLVNAIQVPRLLIGGIGVTLFISCTYLLSLILRDIFSNILDLSTASDAVSYFWAFLHTFFVLVTIVTYGLPMRPTITAASIVVIFIWSYICARWLFMFVSRLRGAEMLWPQKYVKPSPESPTSVKDPARKLKLGYAVLFSAALISALLTGHMINQYISTYNVVMKTSITAEVVNIELDPNDPQLDLSVKILNPTGENMTLDRIEFDIKLNNKFMHHQVLYPIPTIRPGLYATFNRTVFLPKDRMFTLEEATRDDSWEWTVSGSGYVVTMFGETLLRFKSDSTCKPQVV
ncbi:hypothetical protein E2P65_00150 [Candidatus Bathyarchaeota archaeon]|nr:hypothetical protein E2P65_00150 [Candidatus Bathyarchaeota archaeon]